MFDGRQFQTFTTTNGLAGNAVYAFHSDPDGVVWIGTGTGVSRYDGEGEAAQTKDATLSSQASSARPGDLASSDLLSLLALDVTSQPRRRK